MQQLIHYHIGWKPSGNQPGAKHGTHAGIGDSLRALVLLRDHPDPRRLDLRASMRDPFERLWVRDFYLNTAFKVIVLLDASASMGYVGEISRMHVAQEITSQLALSAYRSGDAFGVFAANQQPLKATTLPPRVNRSAWLWVRQHISKLAPQGSNADGLLQVAPTLPQRRSLVFVISDFRWVAGRCKQLFKQLSHHDVVPVVLQDPAEMTALPQRGIAILRDMESCDTRFVWMRASLRQKIKEARQQHLREVETVSRLFGFKPFVVCGAFETGRLNQYFMERQA